MKDTFSRPLVLAICVFGIVSASGLSDNRRGLFLESTYSRGNDDLSEENHETAKLILQLAVEPQFPSRWAVNLRYRAIFSTDHPHNIQGGDFWLKQRTNEIEPNLTATQLKYLPGPSGTSLHGEVSGSIFLGDIDKAKVGPLRGRIAVTLLPDFEPTNPMGVDSYIDWGIFMEAETPVKGNLSLTPQWKGKNRPVEELLRLVASNFVDASALRLPF